MKDLLCLFLLIIFYCSCNRENQIANTSTSGGNFPSSECISFILEKDDSLGTIRNHASEKIPLHKSISDYVDALRNLDFSACNKEFKEAFLTHVEAWQTMETIVQPFDTMRGEMHVLFDRIALSQDSVEFNPALSTIWDTWKDVETQIPEQN